MSEKVTEWLTTGQMIDYLMANPYEKAESHRGKVVQYAPGDMRLMDLKDGNKTVEAHRLFLNTKWRILPRYVSFEEAMKAVDEGKVAAYHLRKDYKVMVDKDVFPEIFGTDATFGQLMEGKWTIEDSERVSVDEQY
ncbi:hypothetical protein [Tuberibacillus sp. Marseille-P3662]|uniref:hypothetical protein n=1 Tax=Tuberibacillus sp. Marseille-P3662 TaxID=1965358 RepID=UPI000A1C8B07|nr:hypothetical protein [Tuberibacillus sp. Marseille-P3662]